MLRTNQILEDIYVWFIWYSRQINISYVNRKKKEGLHGEESEEGGMEVANT